MPAGRQFIRAIIANAGFQETELAPTEIDLECPNCGSPTAVTYQHQRLYFVCTDCEGVIDLGEKHPSGVLSGWTANPTAFSDRTAEEIYSAVRSVVYHNFAECAAGICPTCSGPIVPSLNVCEDHRSATESACPECGQQFQCAGRFVCPICKSRSQMTLDSLSLRHPAVIAFYWEKGVELGIDSHATARAFLTQSANTTVEVLSVDPPSVRVTIRQDGDELQLTYDDELNVIEVIEDY